MARTTDDHLSAAKQLAQAEATRVAIAPLTEQFSGFDVADAYVVQRANIVRRLSAGATLRGHKVGLTAKAMQELLGVDQPDYGHILDDMVYNDGATIPIARFLQPRIEPEITFVLREPLEGPGVTAADVLAATESVVASLEIVDSRIADWRITLADTVADNASAAAMVLGASKIPIGDAPPLADVACELIVNGHVASTGNGAAVLGDPARAVAWLANTLAEFDTVLEAGQLVMPGSCTSAPFLKAGDRVEARFHGVGTVSAIFS